MPKLTSALVWGGLTAAVALTVMTVQDGDEWVSFESTCIAASACGSRTDSRPKKSLD